MNAFKVGDAVRFNGGYRGRIVEVCGGDLAGMYVVRGDRGETCLGGSEIQAVATATFRCKNCGLEIAPWWHDWATRARGAWIWIHPERADEGALGDLCKGGMEEAAPFSGVQAATVAIERGVAK